MRKVILFPSELEEGNKQTWREFADLRGLTYSAVWVLVKSGILRFTCIDGAECFVVTDGENRAAEIRRLDGKVFGTSKQFPLKGVDKTWLTGAAMLRGAVAETSVLVVEGSTDLLAATDLYVSYRKHLGGANSWQPVALLGAGCKVLDHECADLIRGRHVRLVPDADEAGERMREHWTDLLRRLGCTVDAVNLPRGTDLTDLMSKISPTELFSR